MIEPHCEVTFKIQAQTCYGEELGILGSTKEFGFWAPENAIRLSTSQEMYPEWETTVILPIECDVEYKYVIYGSKGRGMTWESNISNRKLRTSGVSMVVKDGEFGNSSHEGTTESRTWIDSGWLVNHVQLVLLIGGTDGTKPYRLFKRNKKKESAYYIAIKPMRMEEDEEKPEPSMKPDFDVLQTPDDDNIFLIDAKSAKGLSMSIELRQRLKNGSKLKGFTVLGYKEYLNMQGSLSRPIISLGTGLVIGMLNLQYLLATPFHHPNNNLKSIWRTYWTLKKPTLNIGHRGMGENVMHYKDVENNTNDDHEESYSAVAKPESKEESDASAKKLTRNDIDLRSRIINENSVLSFLAAQQYGASFVEMDVQLTQDNVSVISHDFYIDIRADPSDCVVKGQTVRQYIRNVKWSKLKNLKPLPRNADVSDKDKGSKETEYSGSWYRRVRNIDLYSKDDAEAHRDPVWQIRTRLALLKEVLLEVPGDVGFNLEIKWPSNLTSISWKGYPERNKGLDAILKVIFDQAGDRRIVLSSFDPDVCILLRSKQPKYPVLFITDCGSTPGEIDKRRTSLASAIRFAKTHKLSGIVSESSPLVENPRTIRQIKEMGMVVFTYGSRNNESESVRIQRRNGVDAIISDNPHIFSFEGIIQNGEGNRRKTKVNE